MIAAPAPADSTAARPIWSGVMGRYSLIDGTCTDPVLWFDTAGTPFPNQVAALVRAFGSERMLYGSDYCWTPPAAALAQIASIDAAPQPDGDTWRELMTRNTARLFRHDD